MIRAALYPTIRFFALAASCIAVTTGCDSEPPPHSVVDFIENPRLLEATMVRCAANRAELKYTPECLNAREAVDRLAVTNEAERRKELEAQSARKREALRRAQQAAAEARARAEEAERQRREAEYLGLFEETTEPDAAGSVTSGPPASMSDTQPPTAPRAATGGQPGEPPTYPTTYPTTDATSDADASLPAPPAAGEQRPAGVQTFPQAPAEPPAASDLESVRDELRRRTQQSEPPNGQ